MKTPHAPVSFAEAARSVPMLAAVEPDALARAGKTAQIVTVPAGATVFEPGAACRNYIVVLDGSVKVRLLAPSGREIVLYRVLPGQTCIISTTCLMSEAHASAEAVAEADVTALALPAAGFAHLLDRSKMAGEDLERLLSGRYPDKRVEDNARDGVDAPQGQEEDRLTA